MKQAAVLQRPTQQATEGSFQPIASKEPKPSAQSSKRNWILPPTMCVSLEADSSPVQPSDENEALG